MTYFVLGGEMMEFSEYLVPMIVMFCLVVGYIVKKWIKDVDNKYIPTIVVITGALCNVFYSGVSLEAIVFGAISGLASTGMYELVDQFIQDDE